MNLELFPVISSKNSFGSSCLANFLAWFKSDVPRDRIAWKVSRTIAKAMLKRPGVSIKHFGKTWDMKDFLNGAKFYHRIDVNPYWNGKMIKVMQIGDHVFWKDYVNE